MCMATRRDASCARRFLRVLVDDASRMPERSPLPERGQAGLLGLNDTSPEGMHALGAGVMLVAGEGFEPSTFGL